MQDRTERPLLDILDRAQAVADLSFVTRQFFFSAEDLSLMIVQQLDDTVPGASCNLLRLSRTENVHHVR